MALPGLRGRRRSRACLLPTSRRRRFRGAGGVDAGTSTCCPIYFFRSGILRHAPTTSATIVWREAARNVFGSLTRAPHYAVEAFVRYHTSIGPVSLGAHQIRADRTGHNIVLTFNSGYAILRPARHVLLCCGLRGASRRGHPGPPLTGGAPAPRFAARGCGFEKILSVVAIPAQES